MINAGLEDIQRTQFTYDFEYERLLIARLQAEQGQGEVLASSTSQVLHCFSLELLCVLL